MLRCLLLIAVIVLLSNKKTQPLPLNPENPIAIGSQADIQEKRNALSMYIWKSAKLPVNNPPDSVYKDIKDYRFIQLRNLKRIDMLTFDMALGLQSTVYHFKPEQSNGRMVLYHQGHYGSFFLGIKTIRFFLKNGYDVMAFSMPLIGENNKWAILNSMDDLSHADAHSLFYSLESEDLSPIVFFVDPVVRAVSYANETGFSDISMIGLSGGGWTTVLASALDERIIRSYPVASSLPLSYRLESKDHGDYEQVNAALYSITNYFELYLMSASGSGRSQKLIFNENDPCCFAGRNKYDGEYMYKLIDKIVGQSLAKIGSGEFSVYSDDTHLGHRISKAALLVIHADMKQHHEAEAKP